MHGELPAILKGLDHLCEWCRSNRLDLNAGKCKSISFRHNMRPIEFVYSINGTVLERVDEIKDIRVIMDGKMSFLPSRGNYLQIIEYSGFFITYFKGVSRPIYS
jgi:hypothetical protein